MDKPLRVMVDMSATLLHHGHIRLLKKAHEIGLEERKEILEAIRYVDEVVPCPWLIDDAFVVAHNCDLLVHGNDNSNHIPEEKLVIFPRTEGISSSILRERVLDCLISLNLKNKSTSTSDKIARLLIETIKKEFKLE